MNTHRFSKFPNTINNIKNMKNIYFNECFPFQRLPQKWKPSKQEVRPANEMQENIQIASNENQEYNELK